MILRQSVRNLLPCLVLLLVWTGAYAGRGEKGFSVTLDSIQLHRDKAVKKDAVRSIAKTDSAKTRSDTLLTKAQHNDSVYAGVGTTVDSLNKRDSSRIQALVKTNIAPAMKPLTKSVVTPVKILPASVKISNVKPHEKTGNLFKLSVLFLSICIIICAVIYFRRRDERYRFMTTTRLSIMDKEIQRACRHIELNYADPLLTLESMCRDLVTGGSFLEALFERDLGMSVTDFIDQVRINRAKVLLDQDGSIDKEEMSTTIGFTDVTLFIKKFRQVTGTELEEYRTSMLSKQV